MLQQLDHKLSYFKEVDRMITPDKGWIHSIRTSLNMTLKQLGEKLNTSPQNIKAMEEREMSGAITLNSLKETAAAMDLKMIYVLLPKEDSLESLVEKRAMELAKEIVLRTSGSMKLEDQENTPERLAYAIKVKTLELKEEIPKYLWD